MEGGPITEVGPSSRPGGPGAQYPWGGLWEEGLGVKGG